MLKSQLSTITSTDKQQSLVPVTTFNLPILDHKLRLKPLQALSIVLLVFSKSKGSK